MSKRHYIPCFLLRGKWLDGMKWKSRRWGIKTRIPKKSVVYCPLPSNLRGKPLDSPPSPKEKAKVLIKKVTFYLFSDNKCDLFLFCIFLQPLIYQLSSCFSWINILIGVPSKPKVFLIVFSIYLLYEKCIKSCEFTNNMKVGGYTPSCTA